MPYDEYGWIVNWDVKNQSFKDRGDSCFFMGLQALNFILANRIDLAKELYERVKKYDFVRHPSVLSKETAGGYWKNQTSLDMLMIWDYIAYRYKGYGFEPPPFHYRRSKFFWGKFRCPLLYSKTIGSILLFLFSFFWKFCFIREFFKERYHKLHLFMLYLATILEKNKEDNKFFSSFLLKFRSLVGRLQREGETTRINLFFRYLAHLEPLVWPKPTHNCCEWAYQRRGLGEGDTRKDVIFHYERCKIVKETSTIEEEVDLDLSEQFWYLFAYRAKLVYK